MAFNYSFLQRQINVNNSNIDRLLRVIEQKQRENTLLISRLENREPDQALDIIFYSIFPRNTESTEPTIPSRDVIINETSFYLFKNIDSPKNICCPITFEPFLPEQGIMMIDHCGHLFTPTQLREWFCSNSTCPVCRYNICNREEFTESRESAESRESTESTQNTPGTENTIINNLISRVTGNRLTNTNDLVGAVRDEMNIIRNELNIIRNDGTIDNINSFLNTLQHDESFNSFGDVINRFRNI